MQQERDAMTRELLRQLLVLTSMAHTPLQEAISRELLQPLLEFQPLLARTTAVIERGTAAVAREKGKQVLLLRFLCFPDRFIVIL